MTFEPEIQAPDYGLAAEFVFSVFQPVNLVSIDPKGTSPTHAQTFNKRPTSAAKWMEKEQADGRNLYYQDCGLNVTNKRPKKNDVGTILCAHVDGEVQPKDTPSGPEYDAKRAALLDKMLNYDPAPSLIINSGNGYQAFWYLREPIKATDYAIAGIEAVNFNMRDEFGGDACQDVAHVMRVPYTRNFPNAVKIRLGRVECLSDIVLDQRDLLGYSLEKLPIRKTDPAVAKLISTALAGSKGEYAAIGLPEVPDKVDLYRLPDKIRRMIETGAAGNRQIGDGSRSDLVYHIACEMRRRDYSDGEILATITNPDFNISSHYDDNPQRPMLDQAARVVQRMNTDGIVAEADKRWQWDDECQIIIKPPSFVERKSRELVSVLSFDMMYSHLVPVSKIASTIGKHSRHMARYAGLCYRPNSSGNTDPVERKGKLLFNTWRPQDIEPLDQPPAVFLKHCEYLIEDKASREVFYDWLAHTVQHPERKTRWAVVLVGPQGTGKSVLAEILKMIHGIDNCSEPPINQITSDFNSWLAEKKLVIIHEAKRQTRVGKLSDYLKDIIVQSTVLLNRKGIEPVPIENVADFLLITNETDAIEMTSGERRYYIIECAQIPFGANAAPGQDPPYIRTKAMDAHYDELFTGLSDADIAANVPPPECRRILSWLLKRKNGNVTLPINAPPTRARSDMIDANRTDLQRHLHGKYLAREWPFKRRVFNIPDVVDRLPMSVPIKERTQGKVTAACRALGCVPLGSEAVRLANGERLRLWVRSRADADEMATWSMNEVATLYALSKAEIEAKPEPTADDDFGGPGGQE